MPLKLCRLKEKSSQIGSKRKIPVRKKFLNRYAVAASFCTLVFAGAFLFLFWNQNQSLQEENVYCLTIRFKLGREYALAVGGCLESIYSP